MVEGLQTALDGKVQKPTGTGVFMASQSGTTTTWVQISPASYYLNYWDGSNFRASVLYQNGKKLGIGTQTPSEMLHLYDGRIRAKALVLDVNSETLPNQIVTDGTRFSGTSSGGTKRGLMYNDYADLLALSNGMTDAQKTEWKTAMNGGWTTNTMSVALILPPIVDKQDRNYWLTLKGANLNLNPASFSVEIIDSTGATVIATVPNAQVQLYTNGTDLVFYYNFKDLAIGDYKIRLWNGVSYYVTSVTINVVTALTPVSLYGLTWTVLNNAAVAPTVDNTYASGTSVHRQLNTSEAYTSTAQDALSFKSSVLIPSSIADGSFFLELTAEITGVGYYDRYWGHDFGIVNAADSISHAVYILSGVRKNQAFQDVLLPSGTVAYSNAVGNWTEKVYISKKNNIITITYVLGTTVVTSVGTWGLPLGTDIAFFVNFNSYRDANAANVNANVYINSLIQM